MTSMTIAQEHANVLQFLINHGYSESAEVFKREASRYLEPQEQQHQYQLPMLQESFSEERISLHDTINMTPSRIEDIREGDDDYFTTLVDSFSDIHSTNILVVAVEPQTNMIATSCVDKTVKINTMFCSDDSITPKTYRHHQAPVLSIDFHPTFPQLMLTTSMDGSSVLVDISTSIEDDNDNNNDNSSNKSVGRRETTTTGRAEEEGKERPEVLQRFKDHERYIIRGIFSCDQGKYFATASYDHTVILYKSQLQDTSNRLPEYTLLKQFTFTGNVETICFTNDLLIVGVRHDTNLHYIKLSDMSITRISTNFLPIWISISPDGNHLLCTTDDHASGRTILFEKETGRQVQSYYIHPTQNEFTTKRHLWHPSGLYFYALGGDDHSVAVIETRTGRLVHSLTGHQAMIRSMAMSDIGLITAGYDHTIKIWSKPTLNR